MTGHSSDHGLDLNRPNVTLCFVHAMHAYIGLYTAFVWLLWLTSVRLILLQQLTCNIKVL
jgi:hypothetical protein